MTIREFIELQFLRPLTSKRDVDTIHKLKNIVQVYMLRKELEVRA